MITEMALHLNGFPLRDDIRQFLFPDTDKRLFHPLLTAVAVKDNSERIRVELDVLGYREKRKKALESLAEKIAKSVIRTRKSITLEPMTPYERKIIHSKLQKNTRVETISVGEEPYRRIIVSLKK